MRALIQRVVCGKVTIDKKIVGQINKGYVVFLGVKEGDSEKEAKLLAEKTVNLRIMADRENKMNLSIMDVTGDVLVISQFTLYADLKGGRRPSFIKAARPDLAEKLYFDYIKELKRLGVKKVECGEFGAYMIVEIINDGPVTVMLDNEQL